MAKDEKPRAKIDVSPDAVKTPPVIDAAFVERYKKQNPVRYERVKGELGVVKEVKE